MHVQGRAAEAIACYEHVALLQPESAEAHANLASCYKDAARQDTAITSYRRALQLRPDFPEAFANLVHSLQCVCEWRDRPALFQRMEAEVCSLESSYDRGARTDLQDLSRSGRHVVVGAPMACSAQCELLSYSSLEDGCLAVG